MKKYTIDKVPNKYKKSLRGWGFDLSTEGATRKFSKPPTLPHIKDIVKEIKEKRSCSYSGLRSTESYIERR